VYRRRRLLVLGLLLLTATAAFVLAQLVEAGIGGGPLTATDAAATPVPVAAHVYVVQPGDSLWSIAAKLDPHGDERPLVDRLAAEAHGADLYPGEVLAIPAR
jgi:nucleoid-associated protein YgaU